MSDVRAENSGLNKVSHVAYFNLSEITHIGRKILPTISLKYLIALSGTATRAADLPTDKTAVVK